MSCPWCVIRRRSVENTKLFCQFVAELTPRGARLPGLGDEVVDELVGRFRRAGKAELVEQFARPYPFNVIYRMLGLPARLTATIRVSATSHAVGKVTKSGRGWHLRESAA